ncbi:YwqG family protein [Oryzifoliimicrobium ureilyticus]|uniref:YwqG family protein n=1 Tax=Oryzifoliimicrobium ureilyticus TaxID=3113724 RepID=UPI0030767D4A
MHGLTIFALVVLAFGLGGKSVYGNEDHYPEPLASTRGELTERLQKAGLSTHAVSAIGGSAREALLLTTIPSDDATIPIGASKFGGSPDLPRQMGWPIRPAYDNAAELSKQFETEAANLYADAGQAPPWMNEEEGRAYLERRTAMNKKLMEETRALLSKYDPDGAQLEIPKRDVSEIADHAQELLRQSKAVKEDFPLMFIAQLDLGELSQNNALDPALPKTGRLLIFYDLPILPPDFSPAAKAGWKVVYDETPSKDLQRAVLPPVLKEFPSSAPLTSAKLQPQSAVTTMPVMDASYRALEGMQTDDTQRYRDWLSNLGWPTDRPGVHQLGGWPLLIQPGLQSRTQLAAHGIDAGNSEAFDSADAKALLPEAKAWHLVLQISTDPAIGYHLPGTLNFIVRDDDLAQKRFDRAWVVYQQD